MDPEQFRSRLKKGLIIAVFFALGLVFHRMGWRTGLVIYLFLVAAVSILTILIQSGRGGGLASSLGGLGGDSVLGVHSASPIAHATYVLLALFVFLSMLAARMEPPQAAGGGVLETTRESAPPAEEPAPPGGAVPSEPGEVAPPQPAPPAEGAAPAPSPETATTEPSTEETGGND